MSPKKESVLDAEQARKLLRYEPETGKLFWLPRNRDPFSSDAKMRSWNTRYAGREALSAINSKGYREGRVLGCNFVAHRVIWLMQTGKWPKADIDHINGVRHDNRLENLRAASRSENMRNAKRRSNNTSGVNGVYWNRWASKWEACIRINGRQKHLGYFSTVEAAASARIIANAQNGFSDRHGS